MAAASCTRFYRPTASHELDDGHASANQGVPFVINFEDPPFPGYEVPVQIKDIIIIVLQQNSGSKGIRIVQE
jgi:hypothetical protein